MPALDRRPGRRVILLSEREFVNYIDRATEIRYFYQK